MNLKGVKFPVELEKNGEIAKCLHSVDLQGWLDAGWKIKGGAKVSKQDAPKSSDVEKDELSGLPKSQLIQIAESRGIAIDGRMSAENIAQAIRGE